MFEFIKKIIVPPADSAGKKPENYQVDLAKEEELDLSICLLFVDIAKADDNFSNEERNRIVQILKEMFNLNDERINFLIAESENNLKQNDSIYEYTTLINQKFTNEDKFELIKKLWQLIYIDQNVDIYEDHLVKKIGGLLNVEHRTIIAAKLIVKEELDKK